jgi:hypothetical protein
MTESHVSETQTLCDDAKSGAFAAFEAYAHRAHSILRNSSPTGSSASI